MSLMAQNDSLRASETQPLRAVGPADFGDVRIEFQALVSSCGVYDLSSRAKISLSGGDRLRWLNGMVTNNIRDLASGRGGFVRLQPG